MLPTRSTRLIGNSHWIPWVFGWIRGTPAGSGSTWLMLPATGWKTPAIGSFEFPPRKATGMSGVRKMGALWNSSGSPHFPVFLYIFSRFWKLRLRGFSPLNEDEIDFVVREAVDRFDDERFGYFFCHKILEGFSHEDGCQVYKFKSQRVEKFVDLISKDFGADFYSNRMKPIILETLKKSNVEWNLIENLSIWKKFYPHENLNNKCVYF